MGLNESKPMIVIGLTKESFEEACKWFKNFKPKDDNSRDFVENIPIRLPENSAQKVWNNIHSKSLDLSFLTDERYWQYELDKCIESEEYFYNNYTLINGKKPEPVPNGYFKRLRTIKARRKGGYNIVPRKNTPEMVFELVCRRHFKLLNIDCNGRKSMGSCNQQ